MDAQKKLNEKRNARLSRLRRWLYLLVGIAITVLTIIHTKKAYEWAHARGAIVAEKFHIDGKWIEGGWLTVRKDWALRLALLLSMNAPCTCLAGFLFATAYYWKEKRDRKVTRSIELARKQLKDTAAAAAADPDPKLINVRYEDLPQHQKVEVVIGNSGIDVPAQARVKEGWTGSVASWWSGATAVNKGGYDGRDVRRRNWEDDVGIEMVDKGAQAHREGGAVGDGALRKRERPVTEWPS